FLHTLGQKQTFRSSTKLAAVLESRAFNEDDENSVWCLSNDLGAGYFFGSKSLLWSYYAKGSGLSDARTVLHLHRPSMCVIDIKHTGSIIFSQASLVNVGGLLLTPIFSAFSFLFYCERRYLSEVINAW
ncbi:hypothetical protein, partial [Pseudomonas costantinii]|uniref:hypothetical protein n=1 Tax=Pseudomonas costantinii TaxID=168469 RepID=UPI001C430DAD